MRHPVEEVTTVRGVKVIRIAESVNQLIYRGDEDQGYHDYGNEWWFNRDCPLAFKYFNIDSLYPEPYFHGPGHLPADAADEVVDFMMYVYWSLFGKAPRSVLDLGPGPGEIALALRRRDLDVTLVEGTTAGAARLVAVGFPPEKVKKENIKFLRTNLGAFDLVWCTELAEHIEPFFASKVVEVCTAHAPAVWFSAADPYRRAHYHHMNERPIEVWDNLFAQFAFGNIVELEPKHGRAARLYIADVRSRALFASTGNDAAAHR